MMDVRSLELIVKFSLIIVLAGIIGYERERIHRPAGLRTHIIVGIGALIFSIISVKIFPDDPARVISNIVARASASSAQERSSVRRTSLRA
jgi:putative Mg2+ transporter-C (MgtC) family protein